MTAADPEWEESQGLEDRNQSRWHHRWHGPTSSPGLLTTIPSSSLARGLLHTEAPEGRAGHGAGGGTWPWAVLHGPGHLTPLWSEPWGVGTLQSREPALKEGILQEEPEFGTKSQNGIMPS